MVTVHPPDKPEACPTHFLVHPWIRFPHFDRLIPGALDLDQLTFADSGAVGGGFAPLTFRIHQLRPKREDAALGGFRRVDGTALVAQEVALGVARHPQAEQVPGAVNVTPLKVGRGHPKELGHTGKVGVRDVDKALLAATIGAAGLAFKP